MGRATFQQHNSVNIPYVTDFSKISFFVKCLFIILCGIAIWIFQLGGGVATNNVLTANNVIMS